MWGKSKRKMNPIMIDSFKKCENYMSARGIGRGHHKIVEAEPGSKVWRQKSLTIRSGGVKIGYINKNGFQPET